MPRERVFLLLLLSLAGAGLLLGGLAPGPDTIQHSLAAEPRRQPVDQRRWQDLDFEARPFPAAAEGWELLSARRDVAGGAAELLVLDWGGAAIRRISPAGAAESSYPAGGGVPEQPPLDFSPAGGGRVAAIFLFASEVRLFGRQGELLRTIPLSGDPHRIAAVPGEGFVVMSATGTRLFASFDLEGRPIAEFGRLLAGEFQDRLLLDGALAADGEEGFVYAPYHLGLLAAYDLAGKLRFLVRTVPADTGPLPRILERSGKSRRLQPGTPRRVLSVHADGGRIYLLSERETTASRRRILDVYRSSDGTYLHSIRLPNGPRDALVAGELLFTVHEHGLRKWRMLAAPTAAAAGG